MADDVIRPVFGTPRQGKPDRPRSVDDALEEQRRALSKPTTASLSRLPTDRRAEGDVRQRYHADSVEDFPSDRIKRMPDEVAARIEADKLNRTLEELKHIDVAGLSRKASFILDTVVTSSSHAEELEAKDMADTLSLREIAAEVERVLTVEPAQRKRVVALAYLRVLHWVDDMARYV